MRKINKGNNDAVMMTKIINTYNYRLILFTANWCDQCKIIKPVFDNLKNEYYTIIEFEEIDVDSNNEEVVKYNVQSIPIMILVDNNNMEIDRKNGMIKKTDIKKWIYSKIEN